MASSHANDRAARAARDLMGVYARLADRRAHLLGDLLAGAAPVQWEHLPTDAAIDAVGRYQWFYHCHAPEHRAGGPEHGHIHLFARRALWQGLPVTSRERAFRKLCGHPAHGARTRHLVAIGLDAKGLPVSLFAVNSWVTGDLMLGADATAQLLAAIELDTGHPDVDRMIVSLVHLCADDIRRLLAARDAALAARDACGVLEDRSLEVLAHTALDIDARIAAARLRPRRGMARVSPV